MAALCKIASGPRIAVRGRSTRLACSASATPLHRVGAAAATAVLTAGLLAAPALAQGVQFSNVSSGDVVVTSPVHLEFAVDGLTVKPAAEGLASGTGHFHVLIDEPVPEEGEAIPFDDTHKHYGKGQVADDVALSPGKHTLVLQFANAAHQSYGPQFAKTITVTVK